MLRGLRGGYRFPLYSRSPKACSDFPRQRRFTLTPVKEDFILQLETASQSLRLPSQHCVIRRSPARSPHSPILWEKLKVSLRKRGVRKWDSHTRVFGLEGSMVAAFWWDLCSLPLGRASRPTLRFNRRGEKDLSPFGGREGGGESGKNTPDPASGAVRLQDFLGSDWFQKSKNYSANTTIISCLATAH